MKKNNFVWSMVAAAGLSVGLASCNCGAPKAQLNNDLDSVAYAFGVIQGAQMAAVADSGMLVPDEQVDLNEFLAGFITAVKRDSSALKMTPEEADAYLREYFEGVRQRMIEKQRIETEENKAAGKAFLDQNANAEGVVTTESGLQYKVIAAGQGDAPTAEDRVLVKYRGTLLNGDEFDKSDSAVFYVSQVVPGFKEALMMMAPGAQYEIWFPSNLGYGDRAQHSIPGGSTLKFELELLQINPSK
jgi:FKBP-type peptidyl-prolyl cis-trans isomerase